MGEIWLQTCEQGKDRRDRSFLAVAEPARGLLVRFVLVSRAERAEEKPSRNGAKAVNSFHANIFTWARNEWPPLKLLAAPTYGCH